MNGELMFRVSLPNIGDLGTLANTETEGEGRFPGFRLFAVKFLPISLLESLGER
jgi:hypothetical protein